MPWLATLSLSLLAIGLALPAASDPPALIRSARAGRWSEAGTWEGGQVPGPGARVQVRSGHTIVYDAHTEAPIRSIHVAGTLRFDTTRDTRLDVGLIKIQAGDDSSESGFDCEFHPGQPGRHGQPAALIVGTHEQPVARDHLALIRLTNLPGLDSEECPAIVCCGGRMDFHGAELSRSWVKLGATARKDATTVVLAEQVSGWRAGDHIIVTATRKQKIADEGEAPSVRLRPETEERTIRAIEGTTLTLDTPLAFSHAGTGDFRGEIANLSRNVIVESADPAGSRGHTMYHRGSTGSISHAEFRHLGKAGKLGKYSIHFHKVGDTMRGTSVVGASIWDSENRWITIHATNDLVVRDCVGFGSIGHGYFLEDGTEVDNILDGNLAVQACQGSPLPGQALSFDRNEGAGFWWANSQNAFTRNVAVECDQYGFRYEVAPTAGFDCVLPVRDSAEGRRKVDIRTLPFIRFEDNEAHTQRRYGLNLGGGPGNGSDDPLAGVGPDKRHPFVIRGLRVWDTHWAVALAPPNVLIDQLTIARSDFGFWRPRYIGHAYRKLKLYQIGWAFYDEHGTRPDPSIFPAPLEPGDDRHPVTVITRVIGQEHGRLLVQGSSADDGAIRSVCVNGRPARSLAPNFSQWEVSLEEADTRSSTLTAAAEDSAGNRERTPHQTAITAP